MQRVQETGQATWQVRSWVWAARAGVLACCCFLGCVSEPGGRVVTIVGGGVGSGAGGGGGAGGTAPVRPEGGAPDWAFSPRSLRVHPLTHMDLAGGEENTLLVLHVELRDRFGDSVKGVGVLSVELARSVTGSIAVGEGTRVQWELSDMADAETSSRRFDPATRTYRIPLRSPAWVARWLSDAGERRGGPERLTLRVMFRPTEGGEARVLSDEFFVEP